MLAETGAKGFHREKGEALPNAKRGLQREAERVNYCTGGEEKKAQPVIEFFLEKRNAWPRRNKKESRPSSRRENMKICTRRRPPSWR